MRDLERAVGLLVSAGTYLSVLLLGIGVAVMTVADRSPLEAVFSPFEPGRILADLASGRAEGFLWSGLAVALATPGARVAAASVGFLVRGESRYAQLGAAILALILAGIVLVLATG